MVDPSEHPLIASFTAKPQLGLDLWALVEPELSTFHDHARWQVRTDDSPLGVILTVHPRPALASELPAPQCVLILDHLCERDPDRLYAWPEILAVARYHYRAAARLFALSLDDTLLAWAHELFVAEPRLRPLLVGRATLAKLPELARLLPEE